MQIDALKIELATPDFFKIRPEKLSIEEDREAGGLPRHTGRTYFIYRGRIVAVAKQGSCVS